MKRALKWLNEFIAVFTKARRYQPDPAVVTAPYPICSADKTPYQITDEMITELYAVNSPRARELWTALLTAETNLGRAFVLAQCIRELKKHAGPGISFGYIRESNCYGYFRTEERHETAEVR